MGWRNIKLGDAIHIKHGFAFKSQYFSEDGEFVVLTPGHFNEEGGFRSRPDKDRFYSATIPHDYMLEKGALIIAMTEQGAGLLGSSALVPQGKKYLHNQRLGLVDKIDSDILDKTFLYYLFNTKLVRAQLSGSATGTKVRHTAPERVYRVEAAVPSDVRIQCRIASVLRTYDDLIQNNRRRIRLLERAAGQLYDEWFVRRRFPGHEQAGIEDGVPRGWARRRISEICETVGGGTPSTKVPEYWDGDVTWVVPSDVTNNDCLVLLDSERKITQEGLRGSSARIVPAETILMTSRASVGFFAVMDRKVATNQGFINIIPHDERMRLYLLFNLMSRVAEIRGNAKGATYPEIGKGRFRTMEIVVPENALVERFSSIISDSIRQMRSLKRSAAELAQARDLLLPRLMNGEIAV